LVSTELRHRWRRGNGGRRPDGRVRTPVPQKVLTPRSSWRARPSWSEGGRLNRSPTAARRRESGRRGAGAQGWQEVSAVRTSSRAGAGGILPIGEMPDHDRQPALERMLGYRREAVGESFWTLLHPTTTAAAGLRDGLPRRVEHNEIECRWLRSDRSIRCGCSVVTTGAGRDGRPETLVGSSGITERKQLADGRPDPARPPARQRPAGRLRAGRGLPAGYGWPRLYDWTAQDATST